MYYFFTYNFPELFSLSIIHKLHQDINYHSFSCICFYNVLILCLLWSLNCCLPLWCSGTLFLKNPNQDFFCLLFSALNNTCIKVSYIEFRVVESDLMISLCLSTRKYPLQGVLILSKVTSTTVTFLFRPFQMRFRKVVFICTYWCALM